MSLAGLLGVIYAASEIGLALWRRTRDRAAARDDAGSLRRLWLFIAVGAVLASRAPSWEPSLGFPLPPWARAAILALFVGGLLLRWVSIFRLGRFFTVDVAVQADHRLVTAGPYRFVRHPSYTGALLAFLGLALSFGHWLSVVCMFGPPLVAFLGRIRHEEAVLARTFGAEWEAYAARTARLLPGLY